MLRGGLDVEACEGTHQVGFGTGAADAGGRTDRTSQRKRQGERWIRRAEKVAAEDLDIRDDNKIVVDW